MKVPCRKDFPASSCAVAPPKLAIAAKKSPPQPVPRTSRAMTTHSLLLLPGDGIGPEVMAEVEKVVAFLNRKGKAQFTTKTGLVGGAAIDKHGVPLSSDTLADARAADAIVFGAVGGPKWDKVAFDI